MKDQEIVEKFKQPESKNYAFNMLVRTYQERIYWHIRKMVIDHEDANDLTQEVFVKVWKNLHKFQGKSQLYTWIYKIATNECLNFLTKKRKKFFVPIVDVKSELLSKLESSEHVSGDEIQLKLQKALLTLPDKQRLVFNMKYFDEMKYDDISEVVGTSVGALKASYHLAVKKIEKFLKED
ncbi:RNA polymerase sigma factor [Microscilla marina]|uniref:RNA polymerase sigma factor n=1 Tax=Microscilla marina TaxID=1027 RepID=UPI0005D482B6|nr:sigma-70 family RNA polymerase sigma factor [Microscilla marina]